METVGDRILHLLRTGGRADRGIPYEQKDLLGWLNGESRPPDGGTYKLGISQSALSRQITGESKPNLELLEAVADIFHEDLNWLIRGRRIGEADAGQFITEEAEKVGRIVDTLDQDARLLMLHTAQELQSINKQRKDLQAEVYRLLTDAMPSLSVDHKDRANSVIRKINSRGVTNTDGLAAK